MDAAVDTLAPIGIQIEWQRIELLGRCLLSSRLGKEPEQEQIVELQQLQHRVELMRQGDASPWSKLAVADLSPLAVDVLACIFACEAQPKIGWLYQELQPSIAKPFITPALLHLLLALEAPEMRSLQALIGPQGELQQRNLIECDGESAFTTLRPVKRAVATLMGWPQADVAPPGTTKVKQRVDWAELVLPPDRERMLREFLLWIHHRDTVVDEWGGKAMGGPVALFCGPSGTGKTFAATVLATELGWPLYRVDLSRMVSKYIGETEKNLGQLFDAADGQPMVLLFDEVDALMSKRGEIKEARDRYANMEVSYLLSRIEEHRGPCILTTNLRNQIDKAFTRRFQMVVEFPRPDAQARTELWRRMLPQRAPRAADLDERFLGGAVNITGGNIRNAGLHAAYLAAEAGQPIGMDHVATAVWRELAKDKAHIKQSDLGLLAQFLPQDVNP